MLKHLLYMKNSVLIIIAMLALSACGQGPSSGNGGKAYTMSGQWELQSTTVGAQNLPVADVVLVINGSRGKIFTAGLTCEVNVDVDQMTLSMHPQDSVDCNALQRVAQGTLLNTFFEYDRQKDDLILRADIQSHGATDEILPLKYVFTPTHRQLDERGNLVDSADRLSPRI